MSIDYKKDFPIFDNTDFIYFDNAATSQRPKQVIEAGNNFYEKHNANPLRGAYPLSIEATDIYENSRKTVKEFINASSEREIIFTRNTSESINLVAYSYGLNFIKENDEIVVSIMEHHSNLLPWQMVAKSKNAVLKFIECEEDGSVDIDKISRVINERTALVAITAVSNVLGYVNPIEKIAKIAHANNALILVDGAQSTPHMAVDVQKLDVDFFAFSGHKLFGPMGIGVLYGKEKLLDAMPPFLTGGEMIDYVTREGAAYAQLPHKFEAGTVNAPAAAGLAAAINYIRTIGYDEMAKIELEITKRALEGLLSIPHVKVLGSKDASEHTGILTFTIDDVHPHDISEILIADKIAIRSGHHCAQPLLNYLGVSSAARASLMFYNTKDEVDSFLSSIESVRERMGYAK